MSRALYKWVMHFKNESCSLQMSRALYKWAMHCTICDVMMIWEFYEWVMQCTTRDVMMIWEFYVWDMHYTICDVMMIWGSAALKCLLAKCSIFAFCVCFSVHSRIFVLYLNTKEPAFLSQTSPAPALHPSMLGKTTTSAYLRDPQTAIY